MVYYKIPLSGGLNYPAGCILICAYTYNGYEYCKFEKVTEVGSNWVSITESEFNIRCPEFPDPEYTGEMESAEYPGCYYRMVNGEKEWRNPPMDYRTHYRTTERYECKPVYVTSYQFTSFPAKANDYTVIETSIQKDANIVGISGVHINKSSNYGNITYPLPNGSSADDFGRVCLGTHSLDGKTAYSAYKVFLLSAVSYDNPGDHSVVVIIKYTKP